MATPSAPGSHIAIHLADRALTPLISSSSRSPAPADTKPPTPSHSQSQAQALSSLTTAALAAYDSASRLDLGLPQRIMIETGSAGPVILHSYLNPQSSPRPQSRLARPAWGSGRDIVGQARDELRPLSGTTDNTSVVQGDEERQLVNGHAHNGDYGSSPDTRDGAQAEDEDSSVLAPPLLVASVVVVGAGETMEGRRAAARLERMGREFQKEFMREEEEPREAVAEGEDG